MTKTKYDFEVSIDELDIHIVDRTADRCESLCLVVDLPKAPVGQSREPSHDICRNFCNSAEAYREEASYRMNFVNSISEIQAKFPDMDRRSVEKVISRVHKELSKFHQHRAPPSAVSRPTIATIYRWRKCASRSVDRKRQCEGQVG